MASRCVTGARALTALVVAGTLTTCARDAAGPGRRVALAVEAVLPSSFELAAFNLVIDTIRLIVVRPPADTVFGSNFAFLPSLDSLQLSADVTLEQSPETFQLTIELLSGTTLLFSGTQDVTLSSGSSNPPAQIPVSYAGPGQNVATLIIGPLDSVLTQGAPLEFRASAFDAQSNPVANFYLSWTTSDPVAVPIDITGRIVAPLTRSTVTVTARTPNNVSASTPITFAPVATALSIVSGCGQVGPALTQLPQPIVAKVIAGDGLGVAGVVVTFTAPAGASVTTAQVVTDPAGLAQTLVTLGPTSGPVLFQVSAPGLGTVSCSQSAVGTATQLAFTVHPPATTPSGSPIFPPVQVVAQDALGNPVLTFTGAVTVSINTGPPGAALTGTTTFAAVAGVATFGNLILDSLGTYTLQAAAAGTSSATSLPFDVVAGAATHLEVIVTPPAIAAGSTLSIVVTARDIAGNIDPGYRGTIRFTATDNQALPPDYTFTAGDAGVHSFPNAATLQTVGTHLVVATDVANAQITGSQLVSVSSGVAHHLAFVQQPSSVTQGIVMTPAVAVVVLDSFNNVVSTSTDPITLRIQDNPGQATLRGATTQTPLGGLAVFADLTLDSPGSGYTLSASASGVPLLVSDPFNVLPTGAVKLWSGAIDTNWSEPGNWSPTGVPGATDNVRIPVATNQPVLTNNVSVMDLTVDVGATVSANGFALTAAGHVDAAGSVLEPGTVALTGSGTTVQGSLPSVVVSGSVTVVTSLTATGNLDVVGSASFDLGASAFVSVGGNFSTSGTATIQMNAGPLLVVNGDAAFGGGSEAGKLLNGTIELLGSFSQSGDPESFAADTFFLTLFIGTGLQNVSFANPGTASGTSHFGDVDVLNRGGGVSLASAVFSLGLLIASPSGFGLHSKIFGNGHSLTTKGLIVDSLIIDNMPLVVDSSDTQFIGVFDDVVFQNFSPSAIQLDVTRTLGSATFNNLQFLGTPPNPGFHLRANDPVLGNGRFTVTLVAPTPTATGARFQSTGDALIIWP